jgi:hypothetical protein
MTRTRPELLAVRSAQQYRRRDLLAYLGLRYYFDNEAARCNRWAVEVATNPVRARAQAGYFQSLHYKESDSQGAVKHREVYLPSPNEALSEAVLLSECAQRLEFRNPK